MRLGVCYYPEHWPEENWAEDARQMADLGLSLVRIGEFAWAKFEPEPGRYDWDWFDRAIDTLHAAGLGVILGTPTATPPKWLMDQHPEIYAIGADGQPRKFGSRRHYCFSSEIYRQHCRRIVTAMAERYGAHPAVKMWQTDNEFGCHDTIESYSEAAKLAFRVWLKARYDTIQALNTAWGAVFWSQSYRSFDEVDLPVQTVTEANPSHRLDFQRFCSDQVVRFNREQVDILRAHSPGREITHNFMGVFTAFDHHDVGADLDIATWDSYPLGFLDLMPLPDAVKLRWVRQGHPDFQAFHHDLYRGCSPKWGVMEQQPGPVNWAPYNPAPLPGMVRLWSVEAIAHGADLVSWFRWRQVPFAQEHMHAGLQYPDGAPAPAYEDARQTAGDIAILGDARTHQGDVALIFDYPGQWAHAIQPQGRGLDLLRQAFEAYSALRQLGLDIDIVDQSADLNGYKLVLIPGNPIIEAGLVEQLKTLDTESLILSRSGSKTKSFQIPDTLPIGALNALIDVRVERVESLRPGLSEPAMDDSHTYTIANWREHVRSSAKAIASYKDGSPFWLNQGRTHYLAGWPEPPCLIEILKTVCDHAGLSICETGPDLRLRRLGDIQFAFNYGPEPVDLCDHGLKPDTFLIGQGVLPAAGFAAWRL